MFQLRHEHWFSGHHAIGAWLIDYSVNTQLLYVPGNPTIRLTHFIALPLDRNPQYLQCMPVSAQGSARSPGMWAWRAQAG